jgi:hypothetical protein
LELSLDVVQGTTFGVAGSSRWSEMATLPAPPSTVLEDA